MAAKKPRIGGPGLDPERSRAMMGNKNASKAGPKPMANRLVEYKVGPLAAVGIGQRKYAAGYFDKKTGVTSFADIKTGAPGLPGNAKRIKIFKLSNNPRS